MAVSDSDINCLLSEPMESLNFASFIYTVEIYGHICLSVSGVKLNPEKRGRSNVVNFSYTV